MAGGTGGRAPESKVRESLRGPSQPQGGSDPQSKSLPLRGGPTSSLTLGPEPHQTHRQTGRAKGTAAP